MGVGNSWKDNKFLCEYSCVELEWLFDSTSRIDCTACLSQSWLQCWVTYSSGQCYTDN